METEPQISVCHFFQFLSWHVWRRIEFARRTNLRISEQTITEELLYHFYQYFEFYNVPIRLFESKEEHRNGGDLEILVKTDLGFILIACQAKITYKSGNYRAFHHVVRGARQIDLLLDYARRNGGIAHYLFYNFIPEYMYSADVEDILNLHEYGITSASADAIIDWMGAFEVKGRKSPTPHFNTFHPIHAQPFHELICELLRDGKAHLRHLTPGRNYDMTYYDDDAVSDEAAWRRVTSLARIGYVEERVMEADQNEDLATHQKSKEKLPPIFKPKFRVVIGGDINNLGILYRIS